MKIVPVLAITNALALALAIFVYVKQGESPASPRRAEASRTDAGELAALRAEIDELKRLQQPARTHAPSETEAPAAAMPGATAPKGGSDAALGSTPPEEGAAPGAPDEFDAQEMVTFRKKVRKANDLNQEEDQENGIKDGIERLVKENKIAPLTPAQKEGVAKVVMASRRKGFEMFRKVRESGALEGGNREDRGALIRTEMQNIRTETQRQLEDLMPAADAKTYLDETARDMGRFGGFGFGGAQTAPASPIPSSPGR